MSQSVRVVAYHAPAAPAGRQWLGQIFILPDPTPSVPNPAEVPFSMNFYAGTRDAALANAEGWWAAEQSRIAEREAGFAARAAAAKSRGKNAQVAA